MEFLQNVWWYLVLIGVMILVHELGHYWAARFFDVKVETFSFGFGPRLFGFQRGETDFRFSAILFGGYVKMAGEQPGEENTAGPRALTAKPRWQRMIIAFAGPAINVVLAVVLLTGVFMVRYPRIPNPASPRIGHLAADGAAAKAGIQLGDQIVQVDDVVNPTWEQIRMKEVMSVRRPLEVWVNRNGERLHFTVKPDHDDKQGIAIAGWSQEMEIEVADVRRGMVGERAGLKRGDILVSANGIPLKSETRLQEIEHETEGAPIDLVYSRNGQQYHVTVQPVKIDADGKGKPQWLIGLSLTPRVEIAKLSLPDATYESLRANAQNATLILKYLEGLVEQRMSPKAIQGPLRIAQMSGEAAREGAFSFTFLMAGVSLNLAIFNLLPIPILDGGVMLMLFVEMLLRRDLDLKVKEMVLKVGFVFLMAVVVFVIYNDISKILPPG
jgi:regulator of sigma E protease